MCGISFRTHETATRFGKVLNDRGIDVSVQTYRADSLPVALTKPPLVANARKVRFMLEKIEYAIAQLERHAAHI